MSYYVGAALLLITALLEASVLPLFRVSGLQPNLTLVLLICWLIIRGQEEAYVLIPIGGVLLGLVDGAPLGTALLAMAPIAFLQELRGGQINEKGPVIALAFTAVMSLVYNFVYLAVFTLEGESGNWGSAATSVLLPATLVNVIALLPVYGIFALFNPQPRRSLYA